MDTSSMFGLAVIAVLLLAWSSDDHVRQKLALLLLFAWASTNIAVDFMGFGHAPLVIPSLDAVAAILVALVGYTNRSALAAIIFILYAMVGLTHITAFVFHAQGTYNYYASLNVLFACQLIILGASSAWMGFHRWAVRGRERPRPHLARR
jgi:hypothetical protein